MKRSKSLTTSKEGIAAAIIREFGTESDFLAKFNPDRQKTVALEAEMVFASQHIPSLVRCTYAYGESTMAGWISNQLRTIVSMLPNDKRMDVKELERIGYDILSDPQFRVLRLTEIMLFVSQFRTGRFGKVYGTLTTLDICTALREFCKFRDAELLKIEKQKERYEREQHDKTAITWEQFCDIKGLDPEDNPLKKIPK